MPHGDRLREQARSRLYGPWILAVVDASPGGGSNDPGTAPDDYRATNGAGPVLVTLDVDGERFAIRQGGGGGYHYDWVSGHNTGYGFSSSGTSSRPVEEHGEHIRGFLAMIDPNTGYIEDE